MSEKKKSELRFERRNVYEQSDDTTKNQFEYYSKDYKEFLNRCKTEREVVKYSEKQALSLGFKPILEAKGSAGERVFIKNEGKNIVLSVTGKRPLSEGFNLIVAHIDCPRLDLKPMPLIEEQELALLKTHYYGGIKKYQWLNIPLALHGTVILSDGKALDIVIGESDDDPVFTIPDLLPHLAHKVQGDKKLFEAIEGENMNLLVGSIPVEDKDMKERVKEMILQKLHEQYGMREEDFVSAEFEIVPAFSARDLGLDRSMIAAYGHDDRSCAYAGLRAIFDSEETPERTMIVYLVDKEEIGSFGVSSTQSIFFQNAVSELLALQKADYRDAELRKAFASAFCLSADVGGLLNPMFTSVHDLNNAARLGKGVILEKYTGSGGKYHASDASAELMGKIRKIFNDRKIVWQPGSLGKIDEGGGGTVAMDIAKMGISVVDCGPGVMGMHSPYEIVSKADVYQAYRAYKAFLEEA